MKVILKADVKGTGKKGQTVEVADGYARNYLIPRGLAVAASEGALRSIEAERKAQKAKLERQIAELTALRDELDGQTIQLPAKCGEAGRLFGSVTNKDVADAIARHIGKPFDRKLVDLSTPIKTLGVHSVTLRFGHNITGKVNVEIVPE
ncbi:50S ribosomal protein L9 [Symbiobacterium thermophilum]|uniref:Large ribosomal subunit protein bL9 n=1 Tax=Symbiobacterium thermophilum TaxID=2734 RepID=A0A953ID22_SYMTR|nr:50S ribosomal protein L9 [Symbiobacterium thermophilum]MBY6278564.1 50S ribosomal protein L9 [Symbiobacterium thermophilum]